MNKIPIKVANNKTYMMRARLSLLVVGFTNSRKHASIKAVERTVEFLKQKLVERVFLFHREREVS